MYGCIAGEETHAIALFSTYVCWQSLSAAEFSDTVPCSFMENQSQMHASEFIKCHPRSTPLHMRARSGVATNIGIPKIIAEGHLEPFTKIYTHENNPLYRTCTFRTKALFDLGCAHTIPEEAFRWHSNQWFATNGCKKGASVKRDTMGKFWNSEHCRLSNGGNKGLRLSQSICKQ